MLRFTVLFLIGAMGILLATVPKVQPGHARQDTESLQGTWLLYTVEWRGEVTEQTLAPEIEHALEYNNQPAELRGLERDPSERGTTITFSGNRYAWRARGRVTGEGTYRLDPTKGPKVIETAGVSYFYCGDPRSCAVHASNETMRRSLYCLEGGRLKWYSYLDSDDLPARFNAKAGDVLLLTFKRNQRGSG